MRFLDWHRTMIHEPKKGVMQGGKMQAERWSALESRPFRQWQKNPGWPNSLEDETHP